MRAAFHQPIALELPQGLVSIFRLTPPILLAKRDRPI
jgi:hypothetical protein